MGCGRPIGVGVGQANSDGFGSKTAIFILAQKGSLLTHDPEASPAQARNCSEVKHGNSLKIIPVFCWCGLKGWGKIKSCKLAMSEYQHQTRILIYRWTRYRVPDAKKFNDEGVSESNGKGPAMRNHLLN